MCLQSDIQLISRVLLGVGGNNLGGQIKRLALITSGLTSPVIGNMLTYFLESTSEERNVQRIKRWTRTHTHTHTHARVYVRTHVCNINININCGALRARRSDGSTCYGDEGGQTADGQ